MSIEAGESRDPTIDVRRVLTLNTVTHSLTIEAKDVALRGKEISVKVSLRQDDVSTEVSTVVRILFVEN